MSEVGLTSEVDHVAVNDGRAEQMKRQRNPTDFRFSTRTDERVCPILVICRPHVASDADGHA